MMNYRAFKKEMQRRGHEIYKRGEYIDVIPNNNYLEYSRGFQSAAQVIEDTELETMCINGRAKLTHNEHYNEWIYKLTYRIAI